MGNFTGRSAGLVPLKDPVDVICGVMKTPVQIDPVTYESANLNMFSISIDRGSFFSAADFAIPLRLAINMLLCSMTTASTFASVKACVSRR